MFATSSESIKPSFCDSRTFASESVTSESACRIVEHVTARDPRFGIMPRPLRLRCWTVPDSAVFRTFVAMNVQSHIETSASEIVDAVLCAATIRARRLSAWRVEDRIDNSMGSAPWMMKSAAETAMSSFRRLMPESARTP